MVLALFAGIYVMSQLIVSGDAAQTARNIIAHERLFRIGIAGDLAAFAVDVILIAALERASFEDFRLDSRLKTFELSQSSSPIA
jgi:hypothetical protein